MIIPLFIRRVDDSDQYTSHYVPINNEKDWWEGCLQDWCIVNEGNWGLHPMVQLVKQLRTVPQWGGIQKLDYWKIWNLSSWTPCCQLIDLEEKEMVVEYCEEFEMITSAVDDMLENRLDNAFLRGLYDNIQAKVVLFHPNGLTMTMWMTKQIELKNERLENCEPHEIGIDLRIEDNSKGRTVRWWNTYYFVWSCSIAKGFKRESEKKSKVLDEILLLRLGLQPL